MAGATGATGRTLVRLGTGRACEIVPLVRPQSAAGADPRAVIVDLADSAGLARAMAGCTTVLQLVGTMRRRFATGDTYETSDIGTTRQLVAAAQTAGVGHVILLSSVGAGRPVGAYLRAKAAAEAIVRDSGIPWTIVRPGPFVGEGHKVPGLLGLATKLAGVWKYRPIQLEQLASAMLLIAEERAPMNAILEGRPLWEVVERAASVSRP